MTEEIPKLKVSFKLFKRLLFLIRPYWGKLFKGMSIGVIIGLIGMILPYLTKLLIDKVYPSQDVTLMHVLVGGILAISIVSTLIGSIQGYFNLYVNSKLSNSTSLFFYNHLQHLKIRFFDEHRVGEIMSRFGDMNQSLNSVNKIFQTIFLNGIYLLLVPPILFFIQWKLAIVSLISIPFTIIIISLTGKYLRKNWKKTAEAYSNLSAFQFEMLTHIHSLKALVLENYVYKETKRQIENALKLQLKAGGLGQLLGLSNGILAGLNTALFTWLGWSLILSNKMTLGDYIAFSSYIGYLYGPISGFVNLFSDFQQSAVNLGRMFEYLDSPTEMDPGQSFHIPDHFSQSLNGNIEINNLSFSYNPDISILNDINLKIDAESVVSIVGPSGSGKTSLLRLLVGMESPQKGEIYFDGKPISQIPLPELRKQITVIWQEFSMFKGSIRDNLTIGLDQVDDVVIREAIKLSQMDELISTLPNGINTPIAEWGATLSGGQKQRLAIARAFIRNTPIIIFDESTSNIDMKTEAIILRNLFEQCANKTIIYVTHRLSSASLADKLCFLESGRVIDYGSHEELISRCESYRQMYLSDTHKGSYGLKVIK
jgi:ABC-type bacteriocin/lantibiotic exporter with double-glycine peptidase domain